MNNTASCGGKSHKPFIRVFASYQHPVIFKSGGLQQTRTAEALMQARTDS